LWQIIDPKASADCDPSSEFRPLSQNCSNWFVILVLDEEKCSFIETSPTKQPTDGIVIVCGNFTMMHPYELRRWACCPCDVGTVCRQNDLCLELFRSTFKGFD
jgi:hypothetical protein